MEVKFKIDYDSDYILAKDGTVMYPPIQWLHNNVARLQPRHKRVGSKNLFGKGHTWTIIRKKLDIYPYSTVRFDESKVDAEKIFMFTLLFGG
jgi:hypothetical protein